MPAVNFPKPYGTSNSSILIPVYSYGFIGPLSSGSLGSIV
jgi:hypothetical protein